MRVLVTGGYGQLGTDVAEELKKNSIEYLAVGRNDFDITNKSETLKFILNYKPNIVIHCAAYTKVDMAETEKDICWQVNVTGTGNIALACKEINAKLLYVSTDYVFKGNKNGLYETTDETSPINYYGKTKLEGERIIINMLTQFFIVRISWLFGKNGTNFIKTMLNLSKSKDEVSVVEDQIGSPTYTKDLAKLFLEIIMTEKYGIYHATNEGFCSWADFARKIFELKECKTKVKSITSEEFGSKAKRPKNSRLSKESLTKGGFSLLPAWESAVAEYIKE